MQGLKCFFSWKSERESIINLNKINASGKICIFAINENLVWLVVIMLQTSIEVYIHASVIHFELKIKYAILQLHIRFLRLEKK